MMDPRERLDAIFRLCTMKLDTPKGKVRAPWRLLPKNFGRPDTVSRTHRRWAAALLWYRLLQEAMVPGGNPLLAGLAHWIACAYRRAIGVMGLGAVLFARRVGFHSALTAPPHWLPDTDLSEGYRLLRESLEQAEAAKETWRPPPGISGPDDLHLIADRIAGRKRIPRWAEPA
jgi:hypothetical protein